MDIEKALNSILSCDDLPTLEAALNKKSILQVIQKEDQETFHTRLLANLLDPDSNGGDVAILRSFMNFAWGVAEDKNLAASPLQLVEIDWSTVALSAEEYVGEPGRLDVYASVMKGNESVPLLLIEYKVNASLGEKQLSRYGEWASGHCKGNPYSLVFISKDGESDAGDVEGSKWFVKFGYTQFREWLDSISPASSSMASQLRDELVSIVSAKNRVMDPLAVTICNDFKAELEVVKNVASTNSNVKKAVNAFPRSFRHLGVRSKGRKRLGDSEWIRKVQGELETSPVDPTSWHITEGSAQLCYYSSAIANLNNNMFGVRDSLWAGLYLSRPLDNVSLLEFYFGSEVPALRKEKIGQKSASFVRHELQSNQATGLELSDIKDGTLCVSRMSLKMASDSEGGDNSKNANDAWDTHKDAIIGFITAIQKSIRVVATSDRLMVMLRSAKHKTDPSQE